jgi:hypothetical protein
MEWLRTIQPDWNTIVSTLALVITVLTNLAGKRIAYYRGLPEIVARLEREVHEQRRVELENLRIINELRAALQQLGIYVHTDREEGS